MVAYIAAIGGALMFAGTLVWLLVRFNAFVWAKMNADPFQVELGTNATYIRMPSGALRKIADYRYGPEDMKRLRSTAVKAREEVRRESEASRN